MKKITEAEEISLGLLKGKESETLFRNKKYFTFRRQIQNSVVQ